MARWTARPNRLRTSFRAFALSKFRGGTIELFTRINIRTPVRSGKARGSWFVDFGQNAESPIRLDKSGRSAIRAAEMTIQTASLHRVASIKSTLPYIIRLENGYSRQAPTGMVRISLAEYEGIFDRA